MLRAVVEDIAFHNHIKFPHLSNNQKLKLDVPLDVSLDQQLAIYLSIELPVVTPEGLQ